jgi:hypothetical protein
VSVKASVHLRAELVKRPLMNQICVVKAGSRAQNEPLVRIRRESVFSTNTKGCSVQVVTASWQDLVCTAVCEHLANFVSSLEILDPILLVNSRNQQATFS